MIRPDELQYLNGFGNEFETEAKEGALPIGQFNPQKVAFGLYMQSSLVRLHLPWLVIKIVVRGFTVFARLRRKAIIVHFLKV